MHIAAVNAEVWKNLLGMFVAQSLDVRRLGCDLPSVLPECLPEAFSTLKSCRTGGREGEARCLLPAFALSFWTRSHAATAGRVAEYSLDL